MVRFTLSEQNSSKIFFRIKLRRRFALNQIEMKNLLKKQAILDIIVTPEHDAWLRLVSYQYDPVKHCDRFKIDNGSGDHLYALFSPKGAILKGFDHESCLSPYQNEYGHSVAGIYDNIPAELLQLLDNETEKDTVTFCTWQCVGETLWHQNQIILPDLCWQQDNQQLEDGGQSLLMSYIFASAEDWFAWASIYYELQEEAWDAAELLYETGEITRSMVEDLNPDRDYDTVLDECIVSGLLEE